MGGDFAPEIAVKGAVMALDGLGADCRIVLYGDKEAITSLLEQERCEASAFDIVATTEVIAMGDNPVSAFQRRGNSSIVVGFNHLAQGDIQGFASAGSTGAMMVGATQVIKAIEGVLRPTIAVMIGGKLLLDVGLNVDCKPEVLEQYALIGSLYAESLGIENPSVALLNIGAEPNKGNHQAKAAHRLLQLGNEAGRYRFVGNIEASHLFEADSGDVIVCDGFVGNSLLKLIEGLHAVYAQSGAESELFDKLNYEKMGGTPILGINAPVIIGHGKSTAEAIKNMILTTEITIRNNLVAHLKEVFL